MKTYELTGAALDWAVAKCEGVALVLAPFTGARNFVILGQNIKPTIVMYEPSLYWAQGGPIIEREGMDLNPHGVDSSNGRTHWRAAIQWLDESDFEAIGPTPLISAMRCYVASKLGENVDVPEELQ